MFSSIGVIVYTFCNFLLKSFYFYFGTMKKLSLKKTPKQSTTEQHQAANKHLFFKYRKHSTATYHSVMNRNLDFLRALNHALTSSLMALNLVLLDIIFPASSDHHYLFLIPKNVAGHHYLLFDGNHYLLTHIPLRIIALCFEVPYFPFPIACMT